MNRHKQQWNGWYAWFALLKPLSELSGNSLAYRWMTTLSLLLSDFAGAAGYTVSIVLLQRRAFCQRNQSQNPFTQQQQTSVIMCPPLHGRTWWMGIGGTFSSSLIQVTVIHKTNMRFPLETSWKTELHLHSPSLTRFTQWTLCSALFYLCCSMWLWAMRLCKPHHFLQYFSMHS